MNIPNSPPPSLSYGSGVTHHEIVASFTARAYGFSVRDLKTRSRAALIDECRMVAMALSKGPLMSIGEFWGRDHGTVIYAKRRVKAWCDAYPEFRNRVEELRKQILNRKAACHSASAAPANNMGTTNLCLNKRK